jgi:hypothetical protein
MPKGPDVYLGNSIFMFGASDTGKTTILQEVMHDIGGKMAILFVFSTTAAQNGAFAGWVNDECIYPAVDMDLLGRIYARQEEITVLHKVANDRKHVRSLVGRIRDERLNVLQDRIRDASRAAVRKAGNRLDQVMIMKSMRRDALFKLRKSAIRLFSRELKAPAIMDRLSDEEKAALLYVDLNPICYIFFDDCGAYLREFQNHPIMKSILYAGRHNNIYVVLLLQDDSGTETSLKKNTKITVFTTAQCAHAYFDRKSSSFTPAERRRAQLHIDAVFGYVEPDGRKNYRKLVYMRNDPQPFRVWLADVHEPRICGDPHIAQLCASVAAPVASIDLAKYVGGTPNKPQHVVEPPAKKAAWESAAHRGVT